MLKLAERVDFLIGQRVRQDCDRDRESGATAGDHRNQRTRPLFGGASGQNQDGDVAVTIDDETTTCGPGDTITVPQGAARAISNRGAAEARVVQVRGGDTLPVPELV